MTEIFQPEQIERIATDKLVANARNVRTHTDAQIAQLAQSIREHGWTAPILIDADNVVIAGHARLRAAQQLAMPDVPCIRMSHLTELQSRALMLADNRIAMNASWDYEQMATELRELADAGLDALMLGFSGQELSNLLLERATGANDAQAEWQGTPEFETDARLHRRIIVSFESADAVVDFAARMGQNLTPETKSIWHPYRARDSVSEVRYAKVDPADQFNDDGVV